MQNGGGASDYQEPDFFGMQGCKELTNWQYRRLNIQRSSGVESRPRA
jgi:hypothetical protein